MENPVKGLFDKTKGGREQTNTLPAELREAARANNENRKALDPPTPMAPKASPVSAPLPKPDPKNQYGTRPGEKRIDTSYPDSPMPKMHTGGTVPKTQPYVLKKGEHVLTEDKHDKLKAAMGLAHDALSHDGEDMPQEPAKVLREMRIRKAADGSHVIEHHHIQHPMEEHTAKSIDELKEHVGQNFGPDSDAGVDAAESTVGLK